MNSATHARARAHTHTHTFIVVKSLGALFVKKMGLAFTKNDCVFCFSYFNTYSLFVHICTIFKSFRVYKI